MKTLILTSLAVAAFGLTAGQTNAAEPQPASWYQDYLKKQNQESRHTTSSYPTPKSKSCHNNRGERYETGRRQVSNGIWAGSSGNESCYRPAKKEKCHQSQNWENKRDKDMYHKQPSKKGGSASWDHSRDVRW